MKRLPSFTSLVFAIVVGCSTTAPQAPAVNPVPKELVPDDGFPDQVRVDMHADVSFTQNERADLQLAASLWKLQTGGLADINLVFDLDFNSISGLAYHHALGHHTVVRMESWMNEVVSEDAASKADTGNPLSIILGETMPLYGIHARPPRPVRVILVMDRLPKFGGSVQVPVHEFGHVLGMNHVSDPKALMYPSHYPHKHVCLHWQDLLAFCSTNDCGNVRQYPCESN